MEKGKVAGSSPVLIDAEAGKNYAWCSCGRSSKQPFCDGSHKGSGFVPKIFTAEESKTAYLCNCKHTENPGFCDGSHNNL